jgi:transposase
MRCVELTPPCLHFPLYPTRRPPKSFDGLAQLVREFLGADPLSGHLFVFRNKRDDRLKLLYWDRDGYAIWYKRLEEGSFRFPAQGGDGDGFEIRTTDLAMILDGIDLASVNRQQRYQPPGPTNPVATS